MAALAATVRAKRFVNWPATFLAGGNAAFILAGKIATEQLQQYVIRTNIALPIEIQKLLQLECDNAAVAAAAASICDKDTRQKNSTATTTTNSSENAAGPSHTVLSTEVQGYFNL